MLLNKLFYPDFVIKVSPNCLHIFPLHWLVPSLRCEMIFYLCQQKEIRKADHALLLTSIGYTQVQNVFFLFFFLKVYF